MPLLQFEHATLHFTKTGTGNRTLIAFHGFGQTAQVFQPLANALADTHTVYAVDIFFHGNSVWERGEQPLEKEYWKQVMEKLLDSHGIASFDVLGFSLGAKFALATLEAFPQRTHEIILLAPDGIKTNMWYSLATYPLALRKVFRSMIKNPTRFYTIANFAWRTKLIDKGLHRFATAQMNTEEKRSQVYHAWVVFRHLTFKIDTIARLINTHSIRLIMILGKHDNVITAKNMNRLVHRVKNHQLEKLNTGHTGVIDGSINILKNR